MLRMAAVTLRFTRETWFPFLHGRIVYAVMRGAWGLSDDENFPLVLPLVCESGRTRYGAGALYGMGFVFLGEDGLFRDLVRGLKRQGAARELSGVHQLGGNFEVVRVFDLCAGREIGEDDRLEALSLVRLNRAAGILSENKVVSLRFVSPLRLPRRDESKVKGHQFLDDDLFEPDRLIENLETRCSRFFPELLPGRSLGEMDFGRVNVSGRHLLWLDLPKPNEAQTLGGAVGRVDLSFPDGVGTAAPYLLLGQYIGAGRNDTFGFGHYRVLTDLDLPELPRRAQSLTQAAAEGGDAPELPAPIWDEEDEFEEEIETWDEALCQSDLDALARGDRRPPPLAGRVLASRNKARALALPEPVDQALQRRVHQLLAPAVEALLETSSYAFRRGISRQGAATALRRAYESGFRCVVRADVKAFFDSVDWNLLRLKLEALWDDDPVIDVIMRWVMAPVRFGGQLIRRDRGLPQGAVLSPLLANLFLDQFDEDVAALGFKLVRYADDLAVCCKSPDEARRGLEAVTAALADLDLDLNPDKVRLTDFEQGFSFLGYAFVRSLVVESPKEKQKAGWISEPEDADPAFWAEAAAKAPPGAWIGGLDMETLGPITRPLIQKARRSAWRSPDLDGRYPVYLSDPRLKIRVYQGRLIVERPDGEETEIPMELVESIICFGHANLNAPVLRACLGNRIPVFFLTENGSLIGRLAPPEAEPRPGILKAQFEFCQNRERSMEAAREIVISKIANSRVLLRRQRGRNRDDDLALDEMKSFMAQAKNGAAAQDIMGLEGRAAHIYFQRLAHHLPQDFGFIHRQPRPAPDPVNAMLNFTYSLLYRQTAALIQIEGLHPSLGILHRPSSRYYPLASDLMEEFRHLAEQIVLRMIHLGQVTPEDFQEDRRGDVRISRSACRAVIDRWQTRVEEHTAPAPGEDPLPIRMIMHQQVKQMKQVILNPQTETYQGYRDV